MATITFDRGKPAYSITEATGNSNVAGDIVSYTNDPHGHLPPNVSCQVAVTAGTVSAITVKVYGSHDGTTFALLDTVTEADAAWTADGVMFGVSSIPVPYLKAVLVSKTDSTGTPKVSVSFAV